VQAMRDQGLPAIAAHLGRDDLAAYILRATNAWALGRQVGDISQEQFNERLRSIITTATQSSESAVINLETHPLPQEIIRAERAAAGQVTSGPAQAEPGGWSVYVRRAVDSWYSDRRVGDMFQEQFEERLRSIVDTATESPESANVD
jgi:hypothetical protein